MKAEDKVEFPLNTCFLKIMSLTSQKSLPISEVVVLCELWSIQVSLNDFSHLALIEGLFSPYVYKKFTRDSNVKRMESRGQKHLVHILL